MMKKDKKKLNNLITLSPQYKVFYKRVLLDIKIYFLLSVSFPFIGYLSTGLNPTGFHLGGILALLFLGGALLYSYSHNKYYISKFVVSPNENRVYYYLNKFDSIYKKGEIELNKFDVEVKQIFFTKAPQYKLILYYNNKEFFVQREAGVWTAQHFKKILEYIRKLQGRPAYTNYIRDQWF